MGSIVGDFEAAVAAYIDCDPKKIVAVSTGHAALHLIMEAYGIQAGDEVITPSFNNIADIQAILAVGAQPVFVDADPETLCVSIDSISQALSEKTRAVIGMDYASQIADHAKHA